MTRELTAAVAGFVLLLTSFVQGPEGPTVGEATAADIRAFAVDNANGIRAGALSGVIAFIAVVVFTAGLAQIVRSRLPASMLAGLVAAGGILIGAMLWLDAAARSLPVVLPELIDTELAKIDDTTLVAWYGLSGYTHYLGDLVMAPVVLAMGSFGLASLQARIVPRWLTWLALAASAAGVLGVVGIATGVDWLYAFWFGGLIGWALFILLVSGTFVLRWIRARRGRPVPATA